MQYEIRKAPEISEPVVGRLYKDRDGDVFFYVGVFDYNEHWLEITAIGAHIRRSTYPNSPLTEVEISAYAEVINEKINS